MQYLTEIDLKNIGDVHANTCVHGDCLSVMPYIADHSIDFILTDLPFGVTGCAWDSIVPYDQLWAQYRRILKPNGVIALHGVEPFSSYLRISNIKWYKYDWIWEKNRGSNFATVKYQPMREHENISIFYNQRPVYNPIKIERSERGKVRAGYTFVPTNSKREILGGFKETYKGVGDDDAEMRCPRSIIKFNTEVGLHPTQKPILLLEYLIKTYTNENDLVLDSCMGSASTGIAALRLGRQFIGVEKDQKYFDISKERLEKELLFL